MRKMKGTIVLKHADVEFEFEVPDDATEEEISKIGWDYVADYIYWWWEDKVERSLEGV